MTYRTLNKPLRDHGASDAQVAAPVADDEFPDDLDEAPAPKINPEYAFSRKRRRRRRRNESGCGVVARAEGQHQIRSRRHVQDSMAAILRAGLKPCFNEMAQRVEFVGPVPWDESKFELVLYNAVLAAVRVHVITKFQGNDYDPIFNNFSRSARHHRL